MDLQKGIHINISIVNFNVQNLYYKHTNTLYNDIKLDRDLDPNPITLLGWVGVGYRFWPHLGQISEPTTVFVIGSEYIWLNPSQTRSIAFPCQLSHFTGAQVSLSLPPHKGHSQTIGFICAPSTLINDKI